MSCKAILGLSTGCFDATAPSCNNLRSAQSQCRSQMRPCIPGVRPSHGNSALTEKGPSVAVCCCGIPAVVVTVRSLGGCHSSAADVPAALAGGVLGLLHKSRSLSCPLYVFRCVIWGVASRALRVVNSPPDSDPWRVGSFVASSPLTGTSGGLSLLAESCILSLRRNIVDIPLLWWRAKSPEPDGRDHFPPPPLASRPSILKGLHTCVSSCNDVGMLLPDVSEMLPSAGVVL